MKHILLKCALMGAAVILGSIGVQAAWTYNSEAGTLSDGNYSFPVKVVSLADPASATGEKISGLEISGDATEGSGDLDFTSVETDTGYKVISIVYWDHAKILKNITDCTKFIAPDLMQLGRASFQGYTALTEIVVSDKLTEIPYYCLNGTTGLTKITPSTFPYVTKVGQGAIGSSAIETIGFPNVTTIEREAFRSSKVTGDLSFPELTSAGKFSFRNTKITSFSAPKLTQVTEYLLQGNPELTTVVVGDLCWSNFVGGCYANCPKLESITPKPVLTKAGPVNPFDGNNTAYFAKYPLVFMGDNITSIPGSFMKYCSALKYIEFHCDKLTTIGTWAFQSIADGAEILWDGAAPTTLDSAFAGNTGNRKKIILKGGKGIDDWKALSYYKEVSDTDKKRDDYPGKKAIGVINGNVWLIDGRQGLCIRIQ